MAVAEKVVNENVSVQEMIDQLVDNATEALDAMSHFTQEQVDKIVHEMALAGLDKHMPLAKLAIEETGRGVYEDKCIKNIYATEYIWNNIKHTKTVGILEDSPEEEFVMVADPIGVIAGVTPVTNPTSTTMFKAIVSLKARNPIIFAFHPSAQKCSSEAARILRDAAIKAGAPEGCIQWIEKPSIEASKLLMNHPGVHLVLATGGPGMVRSAYSTGKPALGVGAGNVPCYIEKTADIERAVNDVILSKTFDNGMICASEQAIIVDKEIYTKVKDEFKRLGCYFATGAEKAKIEKLVINENTCAVNADIVGKSAHYIAGLAGVKVPEDTKILIVEIDGVGPNHPLSREKLSPVLACIKAKSTEDGIKLSDQMLELGGLGHSAVIHSNDKEVQLQWANKMRAGRLIVNSPSAQGGIGDLYNSIQPSLTLGCGSHGRNSVSQNVGVENLINYKKMANRKNNMQWFKVPEKIYFEKNSTQYLKVMPDIKKVFIVTDPGMVQFGYVEKVLYWLDQRRDSVSVQIFSDVEPDPSDVTVMKGAEMMKSFQPDCIIALGGGSAMDAAKGMWLFYEYPDVPFHGIKQKFLDIRKRTFKFPKLGRQAKFVAIPTTSGTGSEVTPFSVITDKVNNLKYPLADYELTPDVAIIDPVYVMTVPKSITADTGLDVLTHAMEAYVSVMANDYTDGLALKAIDLVFKWLPVAYNDPSNEVAREKMHNASCMAGMAFANAFLGINHSLAHKIGAEFHIPHGRSNAILMPWVIRYNGTIPTKHAIFPKYEKYVADERYQDIARMLGLAASTKEEGVESLAQAVIKLAKSLGITMSIKGQGVTKEDFEAKVMYLADKAFEDQCTPANPKMPLVTELADILRKAYEGC